MNILPRRSLQDDCDKIKSDQKSPSAIIEADLTKLRLNNSERYSIAKKIVKNAKKKSIKNVNVQYAFISDNKRKVIIFVSYENEDDFKNFYNNLYSELNLDSNDVFSFNEGINVLQR